MNRVLISAIQKFTLLDYPEKTACIVFTPGCQFRCGYCHNPEFVLPERIAELKNSFIPENSFFNFLRERQGVGGASDPVPLPEGDHRGVGVPLLDGVVITGGEPTLMPDLLDFMGKIKSLGFLVKLDTNGNRPEIIKQAIEREVVDYVAMDVKTSLVEYPKLVGRLVNPEKIKASVELLKQGNVEYEFRSTLIKELHCDIILKEMAELIAGAKKLFLQLFRPGTTLSPVFSHYHSFSFEEMEANANQFRKTVQEVVVR